MNCNIDEEIQCLTGIPDLHRVLYMKAIGKFRAFLSTISPISLIRSLPMVTHAASVAASTTTLPTSQTSGYNAGSQVANGIGQVTYPLPAWLRGSTHVLSLYVKKLPQLAVALFRLSFFYTAFA